MHNVFFLNNSTKKYILENYILYKDIIDTIKNIWKYLQWSRVWVLSGLIEAYMVVNFRVWGISWGARKLARTSTLMKKTIFENHNCILINFIIITIILCIGMFGKT